MLLKKEGVKESMRGFRVCSLFQNTSATLAHGTKTEPDTWYVI
jgi:hypothetical protein